MVSASADSCIASNSWMREESLSMQFCILWSSAIWLFGLCCLSLLCEMLQFIFADLYDVFGTNFLWLGARAVEGILEAQAESPVEGVFW